MSKFLNYQGNSVKPRVSRYAYNDRLSVVLMDEMNCMYAVISKNLVDAEVFNEYCAFVDTNNLPDIESWLQRNNLAKPTYRWADSGFCRYPEYNFKNLLDAIERGIYDA